MARSRRKTKIFGSTTCRSEKEDKRLMNRAIRSKVKAKLKHQDDDDLPDKDHIMSTWEMGKDGKGYWKDAKDSDMRK